MNLNQLYAFCTLARTLHYSRAAEELSIAQPSLSRMIGQLELELGTPLFEKQGRNIGLNKAGNLFYSHIKQGLGEIDAGTEALKEYLTPGTGTIDFAFIYALSPTFVPQLIQKFLSRKNCQHINFHFYQGNTRYIIQQIKDGIFDLGFCSYVDNEPLIQLQPIANQEYVLMVSRNHPLARKTSVTLSEAAQYNFILPLDRTSYVDSLFKNAGLIPRAYSRVEEDHAAASLVAIGLGIAIIPNNTILKHYNVELIPFGPEPLYRKFYMATANDRQLSPSASNFHSFIQAEVKKELPVF